jgi:hypothetical protein
MFAHVILPTQEGIQIPSFLIAQEFLLRSGKNVLGTNFYCPENPCGFNCFDPKIPGSTIGLIRQILLSNMSDSIVLFTTDNFPTQNDYKEISKISEINRVLIVHIGKNPSPVDKEFQLNSKPFKKYFEKSDESSKKRWLICHEDEFTSSKKQKVDDIPLSDKKDTKIPEHPLAAGGGDRFAKFPFKKIPEIKIPEYSSGFPSGFSNVFQRGSPSENTTRDSKRESTFVPTGESKNDFLPLLSPLEGTRTPPFQLQMKWNEKDIKIAWVEKISPEKMPAYMVHGINQIKDVPVSPYAKSPLICCFNNGNLYLNQYSKIRVADFQKVDDLVKSGMAKYIYVNHLIVGCYEFERMIFHHY